MKLSTSVTFMFGEHPFLERFAAAKSAGFDAVEIQILEATGGATAEAAKDAGVEVVLLNAPLADLFAGGPGLAGVPGREADFRMAIAQTVSDAKEMGAKFLHVGPSRIPEGESRENCLRSFMSNMAAAIETVSGTDIRLLLEPMNRKDMPDALFGNIDEGGEILRNNFDGEIGLQFDIFHVSQNGQDPVEKFLEHREIVDHVQFADSPGRGQPGTGSLDFMAIFQSLTDAGYDGWVGAEYVPTIPTSETFEWLPRYREI